MCKAITSTTPADNVLLLLHRMAWNFRGGHEENVAKTTKRNVQRAIYVAPAGNNTNDAPDPF